MSAFFRSDNKRWSLRLIPKWNWTKHRFSFISMETEEKVKLIVNKHRFLSTDWETIDDHLKCRYIAFKNYLCFLPYGWEYFTTTFWISISSTNNEIHPNLRKWTLAPHDIPSTAYVSQLRRYVFQDSQVYGNASRISVKQDLASSSMITNDSYQSVELPRITHTN